MHTNACGVLTARRLLRCQAPSEDIHRVIYFQSHPPLRHKGVGPRPKQDAAPLGARLHRRLHVVAGGQLAPEAARARLKHVAGGGVERRPPALGVGGPEAAARAGQAGGRPGSEGEER